VWRANVHFGALCTNWAGGICRAPGPRPAVPRAYPPQTPGPIGCPVPSRPGPAPPTPSPPRGGSWALPSAPFPTRLVVPEGMVCERPQGRYLSPGSLYRVKAVIGWTTALSRCSGPASPNSRLLARWRCRWARHLSPNTSPFRRVRVSKILPSPLGPASTDSRPTARWYHFQTRPDTAQLPNAYRRAVFCSLRGDFAFVLSVCPGSARAPPGHPQGPRHTLTGPEVLRHSCSI
jgi:hypothetical protein